MERSFIFYPRPLNNYNAATVRKTLSPVQLGKNPTRSFTELLLVSAVSATRGGTDCGLFVRTLSYRTVSAEWLVIENYYKIQKKSNLISCTTGAVALACV